MKATIDWRSILQVSYKRMNFKIEKTDKSVTPIELITPQMPTAHEVLTVPLTADSCNLITYVLFALLSLSGIVVLKTMKFAGR